MEHEILTAALRPGPDCLPLEQLGRYADGALSAPEHRAAAAHIDACVTCQSELTLLRAFSTVPVHDDERAIVAAGVAELQRRESPVGPARDEQHPAASSQRRWMPSGLSRVALPAAAALLVVVGGYYVFKSQAPRLPPDVGPGVEATRSLKVPVRGPIGDQAVAPDRLEWLAVSGAVRYRVRLMEVDRHELWSIDTEATSSDLPASVRAQIVPGKTLVWQVTAYGPGTPPIAESDARRFRVVLPR